jgi:hypothetical protein
VPAADRSGRPVVTKQLDGPKRCIRTRVVGIGIIWVAHENADRTVLAVPHTCHARRLPIPAATAETIRAQQQRVRERFPGIPASQLNSCPPAGPTAVSRAPRMDQHASAAAAGRRHRIR